MNTDKTVVVVPCSGIGKPFGTVSREAAYELCEELRPESTRLVALAKLVLGDAAARELVARHPAVTIDGCKQMCASKMVRQSGGTVAHEVAVLDVFRRHKDLKPEGIAELNEAGLKLARVLAEEVAASLEPVNKPRKEQAMSELLERKVGIVACSGEELAEGTVARLAALKVLNELRPKETVTICLPLFLAGGAGDRAFARVHPTITVDGCDLRCAARGTEKYSSKPAASLVVNDLVAECGLEKPEGRRRLNAAGKEAVELTAERLAALVDQALGRTRRHQQPACRPARPRRPEREATCSCGSGCGHEIKIAGQTVELVALPLIFRHFRAAGDSGRTRQRRANFRSRKDLQLRAAGSRGELPRGSASRVCRLLRKGEEAMSRTATYNTTVRWTGRALGASGDGQRPGNEVLGPARCPRSCRGVDAGGCLRRRCQHVHHDDVHLGG